MLTWNVTYHCKSGKRDAFYQAITELGVRANSRSEDGNVKYDYFFYAQDPDVLLLVETWTEPALQEAHCRTETFDKLQILKAEYCDSVTADKFYDLSADPSYQQTRPGSAFCRARGALCFFSSASVTFRSVRAAAPGRRRRQTHRPQGSAPPPRTPATAATAPARQWPAVSAARVRAALQQRRGKAHVAHALLRPSPCGP